MPANMMIEPAGSSLNVIGSSRATVSAGPMPGSTPTAVPRRTPMRANIKFAGWMATARPPAREVKASMAASEQAFERPCRQGQGQELGEENVDDEGDHSTDDEIGDESPAPEGRGCRGKEQSRADHEAAPELDQRDQAGQRPENQDDRLPVQAVTGGKVTTQGSDGIADGEQREASRDDDGHHLRAQIVRGQDLKLAHVPPDDSGQDEKDDGDDEACYVDAHAGLCSGHRYLLYV